MSQATTKPLLASNGMSSDSNSQNDFFRGAGASIPEHVSLEVSFNQDSSIEAINGNDDDVIRRKSLNKAEGAPHLECDGDDFTHFIIAKKSTKLSLASRLSKK